MSDSVETASVWRGERGKEGSKGVLFGRPLWAAWILGALMIPALLSGANVYGVGHGGGYPLFDLGAMETSPFPSDLWTVRDRSQITDVRVALPKPDCTVRPSDCQDIDVLNTLDGFNLQPRIAVPFSEAIDPSSVTSDTVVLLAIDDDDTRNSGDDDRLGGNGDDNDVARIGINWIVWDPATMTLFVEPDQLLAQATRHALIVTTGVLDASGNPVGKSPEFAAFLRGESNDDEEDDDDDDDRGFGDRRSHRYREAIEDALDAARHAGISKHDIAVASVFTTQSITGAMSRIRDYVRSLPAPVADFGLGPGGARTLFSLPSVKAIAFIQHTGVSPPAFTTVNINMNAFAFVPGAVGSIAYGRVASPSFLRPDATFNIVGTEVGVPPVMGTGDLYFNLQLPSGPMPADGWPVAMIGMGGNNNKEEFPTLLAPTLAKYGIATMTMNPVARGRGPLGMNRVTMLDNSAITFLAGGRGVDADGNNIIGPQEGDDPPAPFLLMGRRDATKQTIIDHMVLARAVQLGMDVDGDGAPDLDGDRMYFLGWSFGAQFGAPLVGLEPAFRASVLNAPGGPFVDLRRFGNVQGRNILGAVLAARTPSLINVGGANPLAFNENLPLRDQPPLVNTVVGAIAIQEYIDRSEWAMQSSDAVPYAQHLRTVPQNDEGRDDDDWDDDDGDDEDDDARVRGVLIQMAKGDQTVPNPTNSAVVRAGGLEAQTTYYRHDLACAANPCLTAARKNPHPFLTQGVVTDAYFAAISRGAQEQAAQFLASDGVVVIHPTPTGFFEVPIVLPLPEAQNFIP